MLGALSSISIFLLSGFAVTTLLFLPVYVLLPTARPIINRLNCWSNVCLLVGACLFLLLAAGQLLAVAGATDEAVRYAMLNRILGPYWLFYWGALLVNGIFPQLLWWRRFRGQFQTSTILASLLLLAFCLPNLLATSRDYLPSSWAIAGPNYLSLALAAVLYAGLVGVVYLLANSLHRVLN